MPSAHLIRRRTSRGVRWQVRFRWRRADAHARYFATFDRKTDAEVARAWVMSEIAAGRFPDPETYFREPVADRTLAEVHEVFVASRRDSVGPSALNQYRQARATFGSLAEMDPTAIEVRHIQGWVRELVDGKRAPATIGAYRSVLRQVLDFADLPHPNPARDPRVRLPRRVAEVPAPPSYAEFCALREAMTDRWRPVLVLLERTGLRIGEASGLAAADVEWRDDLLRVRGTKTRSSRRWIPLLPIAREVLVEAAARAGLRPMDPLWPALTGNAMRSAMREACLRAGLPTYTPHDLRHRFTSLLVMSGVPAPLIRLIVGHAHVSVTLDTYSHVLLDEPRDRLRELRDAAYRVPGVRPIDVGESEEAQTLGDSAVTGTAGEGVRR